ncbi:hypothetical protein UFOVP84_178 [uncultured Caudovirales phage]|uniref:Uncharacterized protein n=1 Tax=uncultured Caudovirales phage TaxID=2100421 RepID=A0A6J5L4C3_9CAUD|nr:hypothetical protein UFOVP84_178 [uncultured Caudovirales phage]
MAAVIKKCSCKEGQAAKYQDKEYGQGNRVMNEDLKKGYSCTVCGTRHSK